jgi:hypothetical protein
LIYALTAFGLGAAATAMLGLISIVQLFDELYVDEDE